MSETAQMSWGKFKPLLADAVGSSATLHSLASTSHMLRILVVPGRLRCLGPVDGSTILMPRSVEISCRSLQ